MADEVDKAEVQSPVSEGTAAEAVEPAAGVEAAPAAEAPRGQPAGLVPPAEAQTTVARAREERADAAAPATAAPEASVAWRTDHLPKGSSVVTAYGDQRAALKAELQAREKRVEFTRRQLVRTGFFAGGLVALTGAVAYLLNYFNPRDVTGFGAMFGVPANQVPPAGSNPVHLIEAKTWLVNLKPGDGGSPAFAVPGSKTGGALAIYQRCVHLGCTVPWRSDFAFGGEVGWFRCPCHGSTYTKGGARVFGPAPRSLDTFDLTVKPDKSLLIDTGKITLGGLDDPQRAKLL